LPCVTPSARPVPILCTAKSLKGLIVILLMFGFVVVSIRSKFPVVWLTV
jgi:hypothetical protein